MESSSRTDDDDGWDSRENILEKQDTNPSKPVPADHWKFAGLTVLRWMIVVTIGTDNTSGSRIRIPLSLILVRHPPTLHGVGLRELTPLPSKMLKDEQGAQKLSDRVGFKSFCFTKVLKMLKVLKVLRLLK